MKSCAYRRETGFVLLENMIAVLLLSLGVIGIALSMATAIKINTDNQARAVALNAASTALEPLYIAANVADTDPGTTLRTQITQFMSDGYTVNSNPNDQDLCSQVPVPDTCVWRNSFIVKVLEAKDANEVDVLTTAAPYESPVRVGVQVDYVGIGGKNVEGVDEVKSVKASYTFVLKSS